MAASNTRTRRSMHDENRADLAAMDERVGGMQEDIQGLETDVQQLGIRLDSGLNAIRKDLNSSIATIADNFSTSISSISEKIDKRDDKRWLWPVVVSVALLVLSFVTVVGNLSLSPMRENLVELRHALRENKEDRERAINQSIERDRMISDHAQQMRREFDYLRGQLNPLPSRSSSY